MELIAVNDSVAASDTIENLKEQGLEWVNATYWRDNHIERFLEKTRAGVVCIQILKPIKGATSFVYMGKRREE